MIDMIDDKDIKKLKEVFVTKEDLDKFATKKDIIEQREEFERYLGGAVEDFKSQIHAIGERVDGMDQKLDKLFVTVGDLSVTTKHLEDISASLTTIIKDHEERIEVVEAKV
jgi:hypothetical protein